MTLDFLQEIPRLLRRDGGPGPEAGETPGQTLADRIDTVVPATLEGMARGGTYDQIGGGFSRYSVDAEWAVPHFEKMLYDNALLLATFVRGWLRHRRPLLRAVAEETGDWLLREMRSEEGGFHSSIDADSEGEEGKFYVWTPAQVREVLGEEEAERFCRAYRITSEGNFEGGASVPALLADADEREALQGARDRLRLARAERVPPTTDRKQITSWNALAIRGLAEAGFFLHRPDFFQAAEEAAEFLWTRMRGDGDRLFSVFHDRPGFNAYLDDYAFLAEALLALGAHAEFFRPGSTREHLRRAERILRAALRHFEDPESPGYFFTSDDHEALAVRKKEWWDNAIPAGNSSLLHSLSSFYALTGEEHFAKAYRRLRAAYPTYTRKAAQAVPHALAAIGSEMAGLTVIKVSRPEILPDLAAALREKPYARRFVAPGVDLPEGQSCQVCHGVTCQPPVASVEQLLPWL